MRIIIDTELQAIIVPESYYMQVDRLNEIIEQANGKALDYKTYIKSCFQKAYDTQIVRQNDVVKMKGTKKRKTNVKTAESVPEGKSEEKPAEEAKQ